MVHLLCIFINFLFPLFFLFVEIIFHWFFILLNLLFHLFFSFVELESSFISFVLHFSQLLSRLLLNFVETMFHLFAFLHFFCFSSTKSSNKGGGGLRGQNLKWSKRQKRRTAASEANLVKHCWLHPDIDIDTQRWKSQGGDSFKFLPKSLGGMWLMLSGQNFKGFYFIFINKFFKNMPLCTCLNLCPYKS